VQQPPEAIGVAGEVMADGFGPLAGIDPDKQNPDARFDTIPQHELAL
jgi:hypothetical protein